MNSTLILIVALIPLLLITSPVAHGLAPLFDKRTQNLPGWPWGKALGELDAYNDFNNGTSYRGHRDHREDHGLDTKTSSPGFCQGFNYGYDFEWHAVLGGNIP